jgi:serine/threonine protein kinase
VHRDLKSLNLLLDAKWNVKVSDFGLTKFQDQMKKEGQTQELDFGSLHWSAPEVLSETPGLDFEAADVFSFGIVLWEVITREDIHAGMR